MSRKRIVVALILAMSMAAPAQADGATYKGKSSQKLPVSLKTLANGRPRLFVFAWYARCHGGVVGNATRATVGKRVSYRRFTTQGRYVVHQSGGIRITVTGIVHGKRVSAHQWRGSYRLSAVVRRHGHVIDRCHLRAIGWRALRPR